MASSGPLCWPMNPFSPGLPLWSGSEDPYLTTTTTASMAMLSTDATADGYYLNSSCLHNGQLTPLSSIEEQEISPLTENTTAAAARMQAFGETSTTQQKQSQPQVGTRDPHTVDGTRQSDTGESMSKRRRTLRTRNATEQTIKDGTFTSAKTTVEQQMHKSPKKSSDSANQHAQPQSQSQSQSPPQPQQLQQPQQQQDPQQYTPPPTNSQREKILQRNRLAAKRCRQKKRTHNIAMETRYREESARKEALVADIERLRSEYLDLRGEMLKHAGCQDEPIKRHLELMVKRITSGASFMGNVPSSSGRNSLDRDIASSGGGGGGNSGRCGSAPNEVLTWSKKNHNSSNSYNTYGGGGGDLASSFSTGSTASSSLDVADFGFDGHFRGDRQGSGFSMSSFGSDISRSSSCAAGGSGGGAAAGRNLVFDELIDL